jgi:hypothetical protein
MITINLTVLLICVGFGIIGIMGFIFAWLYGKKSKENLEKERTLLIDARTQLANTKNNIENATTALKISVDRVKSAIDEIIIKSKENQKSSLDMGLSGGFTLKK